MADKKTTKNGKQAKPKINVTTEKPVFSWQSPEFVRYKKDKKWLTYIIISVILLTAALIYLGLWSGAGVVVAAGIVFITLSGTNPKKINCAVYPEGVVIDGKVHNFTDFKSFWLTYSDLPKIKLQLVGRLAGQVAMPLGEEDPEQIRLYLSKHLPEEEDKGEDMTDIINRIIRF